MTETESLVEEMRTLASCLPASLNRDLLHDLAKRVAALQSQGSFRGWTIAVGGDASNPGSEGMSAEMSLARARSEAARVSERYLGHGVELRAEYLVGTVTTGDTVWSEPGGSND